MHVEVVPRLSEDLASGLSLCLVPVPNRAQVLGGQHRVKREHDAIPPLPREPPSVPQHACHGSDGLGRMEADLAAGAVVSEVADPQVRGFSSYIQVAHFLKLDGLSRLKSDLLTFFFFLRDSR